VEVEEKDKGVDIESKVNTFYATKYEEKESELKNLTEYEIEKKKKELTRESIEKLSEEK
jgi:hypothetical protein